MKLEIILDGVTVVGEVAHRSASDLVVEIVVPYQGYSRSLHLMNLARSSSRLRHGFLGSYGDLRVKELLRALYEVARAIDAHRSHLVDAIIPYLASVRAIQMSDDTFRATRRDLRRQFRDGEIDNAVHSVLQRQLRRAKASADWNVSSIKDAFMTAHLPDALCITLRDDVWDQLTSMIPDDSESLGGEI